MSSSCVCDQWQGLQIKQQDGECARAGGLRVSWLIRSSREAQKSRFGRTSEGCWCVCVFCLFSLVSWQAYDSIFYSRRQAPRDVAHVPLRMRLAHWKWRETTRPPPRRPPGRIAASECRRCGSQTHWHWHATNDSAMTKIPARVGNCDDSRSIYCSATLMK